MGEGLAFKHMDGRRGSKEGWLWIWGRTIHKARAGPIGVHSHGAALPGAAGVMRGPEAIADTW